MGAVDLVLVGQDSESGSGNLNRGEWQSGCVASQISCAGGCEVHCLLVVSTINGVALYHGDISCDGAPWRRLGGFDRGGRMDARATSTIKSLHR